MGLILWDWIVGCQLGDGLVLAVARSREGNRIAAVLVRELCAVLGGRLHRAGWGLDRSWR